MISIICLIVVNKELEAHSIEEQYCRLTVCGKFKPFDLVIKISEKLNRRVEILELQEFSGNQEVINHPHHVTG